MILKIKYRFRELPLIFFTVGGELWQEGYNSNNRYYIPRKLEMKEHQGSFKYRINRDWISVKTLNSLAYLVNEKYDIKMLPKSEMPFQVFNNN